MTAATSNSGRFAAAPIASGGTSAQQWLDTVRLPELDLAPCRRLVVLAPHPDDETLGVGAMATQLAVGGADVTVVSVSDGEGAHPDAPPPARDRLAAVRRRELHAATGILGLREPVRLGMPDGELGVHENRLTELLIPFLSRPATWCAATWRGDGHPDHEAVGRAAAAATAETGATLLEYPIWMWHWASPVDPVVPWHRACSIPSSDWADESKMLAAQCFQSQFGLYNGDVPPVLPPFVLERLMAVGEVVFR